MASVWIKLGPEGVSRLNKGFKDAHIGYDGDNILLEETDLINVSALDKSIADLCGEGTARLKNTETYKADLKTLLALRIFWLLSHHVSTTRHISLIKDIKSQVYRLESSFWQGITDFHATSSLLKKTQPSSGHKDFEVFIYEAFAITVPEQTNTSFSDERDERRQAVSNYVREIAVLCDRLSFDLVSFVRIFRKYGDIPEGLWY